MTEIRNLLHNPRPGMLGGAEFKASPYATVTYLPDKVKITAKQSFAYAQRDIILQAGDWVYSAFVGNYTGTDTPSTTENRGLYVVVNGKVFANRPFTGIDRRYTLQFHLDAESVVSLRLAGPNTVSESLSWWGMIMASKQDYDVMRTLTDANGQPLNLTWFDGDTYPRSGGGLSLLAVYPHRLHRLGVAA